VLLTYTRESAQLADITWVASRKDLVDRFQAFAAARDPELSTAGIAMAMNRATTMGRPIPSGRERLIFSVLSRLQRIPMPRRFFVALKVDVNRFYHTEGAPDQLLTMARLVPRDVRLAALEQMSAVDDPDLWPGFGADYFLQHAADLLQTRRRRSPAQNRKQATRAVHCTVNPPMGTATPTIRLPPRSSGPTGPTRS